MWCFVCVSFLKSKNSEHIYSQDFQIEEYGSVPICQHSKLFKTSVKYAEVHGAPCRSLNSSRPAGELVGGIGGTGDPGSPEQCGETTCANLLWGSCAASTEVFMFGPSCCKAIAD